MGDMEHSAIAVKSHDGKNEQSEKDQSISLVFQENR